MNYRVVPSPPRKKATSSSNKACVETHEYMIHTLILLVGGLYIMVYIYINGMYKQ